MKKLLNQLQLKIFYTSLYIYYNVFLPNIMLFNEYINFVPITLNKIFL